MPRDRLAALRQIQGFNNEYGGGEEERPNGLSGGYGTDTTVIQMDTMDDGLSGFLMQVEDIRELLREFKDDVELVKQKHSEILSSPNTDDRKL